MKYELVHRGVPFSIREIDGKPPKWRWVLRRLHAAGSMDRIEGGQVIGSQSDAEAAARKAIEQSA